MTYLSENARMSQTSGMTPAKTVQTFATPFGGGSKP